MFANTSIIYRFFGCGNEIESHNKLRKYDLALGEFLFTQCGWIRLCIAVAMIWKLFLGGLTFNNTFLTGTGTLSKKNISP